MKLSTGAELTYDTWRDKAGSTMSEAILDVSEWTMDISESLDEMVTGFACSLDPFWVFYCNKTYPASLRKN